MRDEAPDKASDRPQMRSALPPLDGRSRSAKRLALIAADITAQFPGLDPERIRAAAELQLLAELQRGLLLRNEKGVTVVDVVRAENIAARSRRELLQMAQRKDGDEISIDELEALQ